MKTIVTILTILVFSFWCDHAQAYQQVYEITSGQLSSTGVPIESVQGQFAITSPLIVQGPEGEIGYPDPPFYKYTGIDLFSDNQTITQGEVDIVPGIFYGSLADFLYSDSSANFLEMYTVVLERKIIEHGFEGAREYWRYTDRTLVPVDEYSPGSNLLSYSDPSDFYPANIRFSYDYREFTGKIITQDPTVGFVAPPYEHVTENDQSLGILTFDAAPVPIPGAAWLLGSGLFGLAGLRYRHFMR